MFLRMYMKKNSKIVFYNVNYPFNVLKYNQT